MVRMRESDTFKTRKLALGETADADTPTNRFLAEGVGYIDGGSAHDPGGRG